MLFYTNFVHSYFIRHQYHPVWFNGTNRYHKVPSNVCHHYYQCRVSSFKSFS